ncbi:MAG: hypothetical protein AAB612_03970 [Patescibacteria group bacterium]
MSYFSFVKDDILRSNLDRALDLILELVSISVSEQYENKDIFVSSLRKTIIIQTASIIEALLLWKLKLVYTSGEVELSDDWKSFDIKILHTISSSEEIFAGKRKKEKKKLDRLDFLRLTDLCFNLAILKGKKFRQQIDKVRNLRNRLHIGGLVEVEKEYTPIDLEFCFYVLEKLKTKISS